MSRYDDLIETLKHAREGLSPKIQEAEKELMHLRREAERIDRTLPVMIAFAKAEDDGLPPPIFAKEKKGAPKAKSVSSPRTVPSLNSILLTILDSSDGPVAMDALMAAAESSGWSTSSPRPRVVVTSCLSAAVKKGLVVRDAPSIYRSVPKEN